MKLDRVENCSTAVTPQSTSDTAGGLFAQVDGASSVFFRVAFGALMAKWAWDYLAIGRVRSFYIEPAFHFTYYGFDWVKPWPGDGMLLHFVCLLILSLMIAAGFFYRTASFLFALGFTYVFLLDRTNYQNHYYLIGLFAWWLPWLPLNRMVSVDAWRRPSMRSQTVPVWALRVLQFHVFLPYFFGGIAKLTPDWLLGEPLRTMLLSQAEMPYLGILFRQEWAAAVLPLAALLFDLLIVPALIWRKTRAWAFACCLAFHLMNSVVFNIHVFPWFMLVATPIFFSADWPRRLLGGQALQLAKSALQPPTQLSFRRVAFLACLGVYVLFHVTWPLRHHFYPGDASWNERGHYFAWRMMLRGKPVVLGYAIKDLATGKVVDGGVQRFINSEQQDRFGRDPEMILHFAHYLGEEYESITGNRCEVHALAMASLNGRKPELLIDPNVDLLREPRGFYPRAWILEQREPLHRPAWNMPVEEWKEHVAIPELQFMAASNISETQVQSNRSATANGPTELVSKSSQAAAESGPVLSRQNGTELKND